MKMSFFCTWNYTSINVTSLIKTVTKFSNVIGYHQPDLSTNETVYVSYLLLDSVIGPLQGQLTSHPHEREQNVSWACTVFLHFAKLIVVSFFMKTYNRHLV